MSLINSSTGIFSSVSWPPMSMPTRETNLTSGWLVRILATWAGSCMLGGMVNSIWSKFMKKFSLILFLEYYLVEVLTRVKLG